MIVKINRKHKVNVYDIDKLVEKPNNQHPEQTKTWVYLKSGYPKILKADGTIASLVVKLANAGLTHKEIHQIIVRGQS